jgi:hypothetical protein
MLGDQAIGMNALGNGEVSRRLVAFTFASLVCHLWKYNPNGGTWTWVGGSNVVNALGVYGTHGTAAAGNIPGARSGAVSWIDSAGNFWLFGGYGYGSVSGVDYLNDLWMYSPSAGTWTWVNGSNVVDAGAVYGTSGVPASGDVPGARSEGVSWVDPAGNLWLFGGWIFNINNGSYTWPNDLWVYTPLTP